MNPSDVEEWPADKFGLEEVDLAHYLHDEFNTVRINLEPSMVFRDEVLRLAQDPEVTDLMTLRSRLRERRDGILRKASEDWRDADYAAIVDVFEHDPDYWRSSALLTMLCSRTLTKVVEFVNTLVSTKVSRPRSLLYSVEESSQIMNVSCAENSKSNGNGDGANQSMHSTSQTQTGHQLGVDKSACHIAQDAQEEDSLDAPRVGPRREVVEPALAPGSRRALQSQPSTKLDAQRTVEPQTPPYRWSEDDWTEDEEEHVDRGDSLSPASKKRKRAKRPYVRISRMRRESPHFGFETPL